MITNPYPKDIIDETSGISVPSGKHQIWQEGYEAGWNEAKELVSKINKEAGDLRTFERMVLAAFVGKGE